MFDQLRQSDNTGVQFHAKRLTELAKRGDRIVLGPSDDGGYYLIGLKKMHRRLFEEIDWSTERVLEQTMRRAQEINMPVHLLPAGFDVDDRATLHRLMQRNSITRRRARDEKISK